MSEAIYCVMEIREGWVVRFNGSDYGPAASRACAVAAALQVAAKAHGQGLQSQVLIRLGEQFRTIWVNGRDLLGGGAGPAERGRGMHGVSGRA